MGFAVFCLLAGSRWLVEDAYPSTLPPLLGQGFRFAVIALLALAFWLPRRESLSGGCWRMGVAGVLLLCVPGLVNAWARSSAEPALFTLFPLSVVVAMGALSAGQGGRRLMMPALVGAAGGLLVLPFTLPTTFSGAAIMGAVLVAVAIAAVGSVWLHRLVQEVEFGAGVLVVCGVNAVVLGSAGVCLEGARVSSGASWGEWTRASIFDLPEMVLLLWLLREMRPERAAARWFLVPLVTVVEGVVLLRPRVDLRLCVGLGLMAACGVALFLPMPVEEETGLHLN